jgi:hypothetical protein
MRAAKWVEKTENQHWILACDLGRLSVQAVFDRLALSLGELPTPHSAEEAALAARLRDVHGVAGEALRLSVASLLGEPDKASPATQRRG